MITVAADAAFEAVFESGETGFLGTVEVAVEDNDGNTVLGPTSLNVTETSIDSVATGTYVWNAPAAPSTNGQYTIIWSLDGSFDPDTVTVEDLVVEQSFAPQTEDPILCSGWTSAEDVMECCSAEIGSDTTYLEMAVDAAGEILYLASGKQYPGICQRTVRPCRTAPSCACGTQVLARGYVVGWDGSCWSGHDCGCSPVPAVKLAGYAREIIEVKIDGVVVDPATYALKKNRWLMRISPDSWPACQTENVPDTEAGTFSVTYTYGKTPPLSGILAAQALACEIVKACTPGAECALPNGAVRVTRQGITFERTRFVRDEDGVWVTGVGTVDLFLNTVNPNGLARNGVGWSPALSSRYAPPDFVQ